MVKPPIIKWKCHYMSSMLRVDFSSLDITILSSFMVKEKDNHQPTVTVMMCNDDDGGTHNDHHWRWKRKDSSNKSIGSNTSNSKELSRTSETIRKLYLIGKARHVPSSLWQTRRESIDQEFETSQDYDNCLRRSCPRVIMDIMVFLSSRQTTRRIMFLTFFTLVKSLLSSHIALLFFSAICDHVVFPVTRESCWKVTMGLFSLRHPRRRLHYQRGDGCCCHRSLRSSRRVNLSHCGGNLSGGSCGKDIQGNETFCLSLKFD